MKVELVDSMGDDKRVVQAARVSTGSDLQIPEVAFETVRGLIKYLMKHRHGTPFEHNAYTFRVECPIFVAREFMRHRIASYNEESGRYSQLKPVFWLPSPARGLVQEGKPGHYDMRPGTPGQYAREVTRNKLVASFSYDQYLASLADGICREVARAKLPLSIYTSFYVTENARALMNFLSLRIDDPDNTYVTKPQFEIQQAALDIQDHFSTLMPVTYNAFDENGRVAP
jgi:thymidylate synthase (FAD)